MPFNNHEPLFIAELEFVGEVTLVRFYKYPLRNMSILLELDEWIQIRKTFPFRVEFIGK